MQISLQQLWLNLVPDLEASMQLKHDQGLGKLLLSVVLHSQQL